MTYQIAYETADGTVDGFMTETSKARAMDAARRAAKESPLNAAFGVTRWMVDKCEQTVARFEVGA